MNDIRMRWMSAVAAIVLATGCATKVEKGSSSASGAAPADVAAKGALPDQPVPIPAVSKRKVVLAMSGPPNVTGARDWPAFKEEFRAVFAEHARDGKVAFAVHEGTGPPGAEDGTLVSIHVNDYRMIGIGARILLGVMIGNAYIDAKVRFADLRTGQAFGEQAYNTSSNAWHGIFAKMTPQQVDAIAAEVFGEVKRP